MAPIFHNIALLLLLFKGSGGFFLKKLFISFFPLSGNKKGRLLQNYFFCPELFLSPIEAQALKGRQRDISGDKSLREDITGNKRFAGGYCRKTIIFKVYGNFTRPYLRLCLIISAPGSWGKRHGKRFSSPKPPTLSAGAAQIWGAMVIRDLRGGGLRQGICGAFFLRLRITP